MIPETLGTTTKRHSVEFLLTFLHSCFWILPRKGILFSINYMHCIIFGLLSLRNHVKQWGQDMKARNVCMCLAFLPPQIP